MCDNENEMKDRELARLKRLMSVTMKKGDIIKLFTNSLINALNDECY